MSEFSPLSPESQSRKESVETINIRLDIISQQMLREAILYAAERLAATRNPSRSVTKLHDIPVTGNVPASFVPAEPSYSHIYSGISVSENRDSLTDSTAMVVQLLDAQTHRYVTFSSLSQPQPSVRDKFFEVQSDTSSEPTGLLSFEDLALLLDDLTPDKKNKIASLADPRQTITFAEAADTTRKILQPIAGDQVIQEEYFSNDLIVSSKTNTPHFTEGGYTLRTLKTLDRSHPEKDTSSVYLGIKTAIDIWGHDVEQEVAIAMNLNPKTRHKRRKAKLIEDHSVDIKLSVKSTTMPQADLHAIAVNSAELLNPVTFTEKALKRLGVPTPPRNSKRVRL